MSYIVAGANALPATLRRAQAVRSARRKPVGMGAYPDCQSYKEFMTACWPQAYNSTRCIQDLSNPVMSTDKTCVALNLRNEGACNAALAAIPMQCPAPGTKVSYNDSTGLVTVVDGGTGNTWTASASTPDWQSAVNAGQTPAGGTLASILSGSGTSASSGTSSATYSPKLSFSTSSGNTSTPKVGDSWSISISGAQPNTAVYSQARGSTTQMGTTDASGNFNLSGTFNNSVLGAWSETWTVGTQTAGQISFTVVGVTSSATSTTAATGSATNDSSSWLTASPFGGIPNWGLAAGAVVALLVIAMGRH